MQIRCKSALFAVKLLHIPPFSRPDVEMIMTDYVHAAAFRDNTLGLPKVCPDPQAITREHIYAFMSKYFVPERMIVVGES